MTKEQRDRLRALAEETRLTPNMRIGTATVLSLLDALDAAEKALDEFVAATRLTSHCEGWMSCDRYDEIPADRYPALYAYLKKRADK